MHVFHVSTQTIPPGQALQPYRLGVVYADLIATTRHALASGPEAVQALLGTAAWARLPAQQAYLPEMVILEAVFEHVRCQRAPGFPSRLASSFAWARIELAQRFCTDYLPQGVIHRCHVVAGTAVELDGGLVAAGINLRNPLDDELHQLEQRAHRYWRARQPMTFPELVVRGTVRVEASLVAE